MKKTMKLIFTLLIVLIIAVSCKNQKKSADPPAYYYDVLRIKADLASSSMHTIYNPADFEELEQDILAGKVNCTDCIYRLRKIFNKYHVAHVYLMENDSEKNKTMVLPVVFYNFGNEYHICSATKKYEKYLGWKVNKINDIAINEAIERIAEFRSYETVISTKYYLERNISYNDYKYAQLLNKKGKLKVELKAPDGKTEILNLKFINGKKNPFNKLRLEKENNYLPHFEVNNYAVKPCKERQTLFIHFNRCIEMEDYPASEWFSDIIKELDTGLYDTVVFDLRYNTGGNSFTYEFLEKYKEEWKKYHIALIATGRTYSASTWFMEAMLKMCPDAKIFGEETGQAIHNYTGIINEELKGLKCKFWFPLFLDEISPLTLIKDRTDEYYRGIMPDVEVQESFEDFMKGEDSIYNAIYDYFNKYNASLLRKCDII